MIGNRIIDRKGRLFGRVNLLDLAVLSILAVAMFIAVKFIFFRPDFFMYKDVVAEISFNGTPLSDMTSLSKGKNFLYDDKNSYLLISETIYANCSNRGSRNLEYYFNDSHFVLTEKMLIDLKQNGTIISLENIKTKLSKEREAIPDIKDYTCYADFLFKIKTRIINDMPFYERGWYKIGKGNYFEARVGNITINGIIKEVYQTFDEVGNKGR